MQIRQRDQLPGGIAVLPPLGEGAPPQSGVAFFSTPEGHNIVRSVDRTEHGTLLHVSISHSRRRPTWDEIKEVKDYFFGDDKDAIMVLPRSELYVNIHENCFQLWELPRIPGSTGRWELM